MIFEDETGRRRRRSLQIASGGLLVTMVPLVLFAIGNLRPTEREPLAGTMPQPTLGDAPTSDEIAPTSVAKVSLATGLVYAYTTRPSWWGVSAWYLTAIDARTGETAFSVRTGTGTLFNNHYSAVTLGPDGSAYVATLGGMVRVRDQD